MCLRTIVLAASLLVRSLSNSESVRAEKALSVGAKTVYVFEPGRIDRVSHRFE